MKLTNTFQSIRTMVFMIVAGALLLTAFPETSLAQKPVVIYGYYGEDGNDASNPGANSYPDPVTTYHWNYNYPNDYAYIYGFYFGGYYYYTKAYSEFIVSANDLRAAGLCAGPLDQLGLQWVVNVRQLNANMKIYMQHTTRPTFGGIFDTYRGYPWYYMHNVRKSGNSLIPHRDATLVSDVNYQLPVINYEGNNYQTDRGPALHEIGQ